MKFADIIGHDDLKRRLTLQVDMERVSHAQLFTGLAGYGSAGSLHQQHRHRTPERDGQRGYEGTGRVVTTPGQAPEPHLTRVV